MRFLSVPSEYFYNAERLPRNSRVAVAVFASDGVATLEGICISQRYQSTDPSKLVMLSSLDNICDD